MNVYMSKVKESIHKIATVTTSTGSPKSKNLTQVSVADRLLSNKDQHVDQVKVKVEEPSTLCDKEKKTINKLFSVHSDDIKMKVEKNLESTDNYIKTIKPFYTFKDKFKIYTKVASRNDLDLFPRLTKNNILFDKINTYNEFINFNNNQIKKIFTSKEQASLSLLNLLLNNRTSFFPHDYIFQPSHYIETKE